jgi:16S rRNA G1207 methylase RsmC
MPSPRGYIPPLGFHFLTPFYDVLVRWTTREAAFKAALLEQLGSAPRERLLDVGCGTGTLTISLAKRFPNAHVVGLDADGAGLAIARAKADDARVKLDLEQAFADACPSHREPSTLQFRACFFIISPPIRSAAFSRRFVAS